MGWFDETAEEEAERIAASRLKAQGIEDRFSVTTSRQQNVCRTAGARTIAPGETFVIKRKATE